MVNREARLSRLIRRYYRILPGQVFSRIGGIHLRHVREIKRRLRLPGTFLRQDRFANTREFPKLSRLPDSDRQTALGHWQSLRENYGRTHRSRRMKYLISRYNRLLPTFVFARIFGVTHGAVRRYEVDRGITLSCSESNKLRMQFIHASAPPAIAELTPDETFQVRRCWEEFSNQRGRRLDRDDLLRNGANKLPTLILAALLNVTPSAICARLRKLAIDTAGKPEMGEFLELQTLPRIDGLDSREQKLVERIFAREKALRKKRRKRRFLDRRARLLKKLLGLRTSYRKAARSCSESNRIKEVRCSKPDCGYSWPRSQEFFNRHRFSEDGLEHICKLCHYSRRADPDHRSTCRRKEPRKLYGDERRRAMEIVRQNAELIPSRLLEELLQINKNHLYYLRLDAGVEVTTPQMMKLWSIWMGAESMPAVAALTDDEISRLRSNWLRHRTKYRESRWEDDGRLQIMREERVRILREQEHTGQEPAMLICYGPYCKGEDAWPAEPRSTFFYCIGGRGGEKKRRCRACANLESRLAKSGLQ